MHSSGVRRVTRRMTKGSCVVSSAICDCSVPFPSHFFVFLERCRDAYPFFLSEEDKEDVGLVFVPLTHLCSRVS